MLIVCIWVVYIVVPWFDYRKSYNSWFSKHSSKAKWCKLKVNTTYHFIFYFSNLKNALAIRHRRAHQGLTTRLSSQKSKKNYIWWDDQADWEYREQCLNIREKIIVFGPWDTKGWSSCCKSRLCPKYTTKYLAFVKFC